MSVGGTGEGEERWMRRCERKGGEMRVGEIGVGGTRGGEMDKSM